jgi:hypothetical protein
MLRDPTKIPEGALVEPEKVLLLLIPDRLLIPVPGVAKSARLPLDPTEAPSQSQKRDNLLNLWHLQVSWPISILPGFPPKDARKALPEVAGFEVFLTGRCSLTPSVSPMVSIGILVRGLRAVTVVHLVWPIEGG